MDSQLVHGGDGSQGTTEVSPEFRIKHPLQHSWCWWYDKPQTKKVTQHSWGDQMMQIYTFDTVEDFWSLWNNIKGVQELPMGAYYHLFKEGIQPKWEDPVHKVGGRWVFQLRDRDDLGQYWLAAVLACIGCSFEEDDEEICGIAVNIRRFDRISLWTRTADNASACKRIGQQLREVLGIPFGQLSYQAHADASNANSSSRYTA